MPLVKSKNGLKQGTFCNEFNDYREKLLCMNGNIVIVGDFNIDWLNTNHVSLREHACVSSRGAQSTELVSLYIGYWTLNNYYYYTNGSERKQFCNIIET